MVMRRAMLIAGRWVETGATRPIHNPFNSEGLADVCLAGKAEAEEAIRAAVSAFAVSRKLPAHARSLGQQCRRVGAPGGVCPLSHLGVRETYHRCPAGSRAGHHDLRGGCGGSEANPRRSHSTGYHAWHGSSPCHISPSPHWSDPRHHTVQFSAEPRGPQGCARVGGRQSHRPQTRAADAADFVAAGRGHSASRPAFRHGEHPALHQCACRADGHGRAVQDG